MPLLSVPKDWWNVFDGLLAKTGVTLYQIRQYTGLDIGYLSRLRTGQKRNPSIDTLLSIAFALVHLSSKVTLYDVDRLFKSAGRFLPLKHR